MIVDRLASLALAGRRDNSQDSDTEKPPFPRTSSPIVTSRPRAPELAAPPLADTTHPPTHTHTQDAPSLEQCRPARSQLSQEIPDSFITGATTILSLDARERLHPRLKRANTEPHTLRVACILVWPQAFVLAF
jgi:hypothetical protein